MATYVILNLIFLAAVFACLWWKRVLRWDRAMTATLIILLITTAVFDSLIIQAGIVAYDFDKTLGVRIGAAPVEDFFYALLAALLVPNVWRVLKKGDTNA